MTVEELMSILEDCDPEAEVYMMTQPSYPFEYAVSGVAVREEFQDIKGKPGGNMRGNPCASDVFITEGAQLRHGSRDAWDAERRV